MEGGGAIMRRTENYLHRTTSSRPTIFRLSVQFLFKVANFERDARTEDVVRYFSKKIPYACIDEYQLFRTITIRFCNFFGFRSGLLGRVFKKNRFLKGLDFWVRLGAQ